MADVIAPEIQLGRLAGIVALLDELADDERLEQRAAHGVRSNRGGIANPQQPGGQTDIEEIQLGRLDQALAKVAVIRRQQTHYVARFQHRKPLPRGDVADATVRRQRRQVKQLPATRGAHFQEALKQSKLAHGKQLANIALDIGGNIVWEPVLGRKTAVVERGVGALPQCNIHAGGCHSGAGELRLGKRQQMYQTDAAGERLRYLRQQPELLRAREHEVAHAAALIDPALQI